ncbi:MAG TPA: archease [Methylomirabilota bacterium]
MTGSTLPEAFTRLALGLFAAAVDPATVEETEIREVRAHGGGVSALLQAWLQECLYVHEVEGFACRTIEFAVFDATPGAGGETVRLHAILRGEGIDAARHQIRPIRNVLTSELIATGGPSGPFQARATLEP